MLTFNKNYFGLTALIFTIEIIIALFVKDKFVRPYLGDVLVVILLYCFAKSFIQIPSFLLAAGVLLFSFTIEFLQYIKVVEKIGLEKSTIARTVIGTSFAWLDLLAYVGGITIVLFAENYQVKKLAA